MKILFIAVAFALLAAYTPQKKATKNVWKAQKATFNYPGSIPPEPKDTTKINLKK